jgi:hypothetical protein
MKIYQGEGVTINIAPTDSVDNLLDYDIDVALISETNMHCCVDCKSAAILYWENIDSYNQVASFRITEEQTKALAPGRYFFEVALYPTNNENTMKTQTLSVIEILPSYTK